MVYQTIITDRKKLNWSELINQLNENGILWIISEDSYKNNSCETKTFNLIKEGLDEGLILKNVILWINKFDKINSFITNNYKSILFFVKSENYFFNKDAIREKHIWKDVEWGKREKNYNPKGKDPGNVWILTEDNGKGKITGFNALSIKEVLDRCISCSTNKGDKSLIDIKNETRI